jgi:SNF2 family DNA or RNA helicase
MIDSQLFKKLKFTQGDREKGCSWLRKLEAIEEYLKTMSFMAMRKDQDLDIPQSHPAQLGSGGLDNRLRFKLEFDSILHENQEIPTTSCLLYLYELVSDSTFHPIHSREALDVLCLECSRETRYLSDLDSAWLKTLVPYFFTHPNGKLSILLPTSLEIKVLKALCAQRLLFYFDQEPKTYHWGGETAKATHFILQLQEIDEEWKLWGKFVDAKSNTTDLWDIQAVTLGGVARQSQQLFEYDGLTYPWIEILLSGGSIRCPGTSLRDFLYHLLCLLDQSAIEWPVNMSIKSTLASTHPIFYVKTKDDKRNFKTKIEGFAWFRAEGFEYPSEVHKDSVTPPQPKVFQVHVRKTDRASDQSQYHVSIQVPDRETEHTRLREVENCIGLSWNDNRLSFDVERPHATEIFYFLLNRGWEVWAENLQVKIMKEIEIQLMTHPNWFEVDLMTGKPATKISAWQLIHMLKKERMFIRLSDGSLGLLPERWYQEFERLFALRYPDLSGKEEESLRFSTAHAFHLAQMAEMAENSDEVNFRSDSAFEQVRHEILNITGLKPMKPAPTFMLTLRSYQEMGLSWLHFLGRARLGGCLADDMGLGKTVQVLAYLDLKRFELQKETRFKSLLVCPRSLLEYWFQEAKKCAPRLKVFILRSSEIHRLESLFEHYDLFLISYGLARLHVQALQKYQFDLLALDEAQLIKNSGAQITMAVNQLRGVQRLAITGTPIENHMGEFFSLFEFLNPGLTNSALLKTLNAQTQGDAVPNFMLAQFLKGIRPLVLRRMKSEVAKELPEKLDQVLILPMEERQENIYISLKNYYQEQLKKQTSELFYDKSFFLEGLLRLRQASCHPLLFENSILNQSGFKLRIDENEESVEISSNKFEFLIDKLKILVSSNHKAIVFSQFTSLLKLFRKVLNELEIPYEYLDGQSQNRMEIVTRFQENQEIPILLAGMKTGGLGLNLTAADYCFILDPWWNPAIEQQAVDRIHRIGQDKAVNIYRIVSQNTVEEKMLVLKECKQKIADQLMTADQSFLEQLNYEDFQFLFQ